MPAVAPTPVDALPPFPSTSSPATFDDLADDHVEALPGFRTQVNALGTNVYENAVFAKDQADLADADRVTTLGYRNEALDYRNTASAHKDAAAASALSAVNAPGSNGTSVTAATIGAGTKTVTTQTGKNWVVGQPATMALRTDAGNYLMWGTISAYNSGTGSWSLLVGAGDFKGSGTYSDWVIGLAGQEGPPGADAMLTTPTLVISGATTLVAGNNGYTCKVVGGAPITLDTLGPTGLYEGWGITLVPDTPASQPVVTADFGAGSEVRVVAGTTDLSVQQVSGVYSVRWLPRGNAVPVFGGLGTPAVINAGACSQGLCSVAISATRSMVLYASASHRPRLALINNLTGAVISTSGDLEAVALSGATPQGARVDDNTAAFIWSVSGAVKAVLGTNTADVVGSGAILAVEAVNSNCQSIALQAAGKLIATYSDTSNTRTSGLTLTVSGTTLTGNTRYTLLSNSCAQIRTAVISATQSVAAFVPTGTVSIMQALPITEAANVLTFPATSETIYRTQVGAAYGDICYLTGARLVVTAGTDAPNGGRAASFVLDVTGTGASAKLQPGAQRPITTPSGMLSGHRLAKVNTTTLMHLASIYTSAAGAVVEVLYVEGDAVRPGGAKQLIRNVSLMDLAYSQSTRWYGLAVYADADNSNYPTSMTFNLGSVA